MKQINICLIDEPLDMIYLREVLGFLPEITLINQNQNFHDKSIGHGTLCMALLIESLHAHHILPKVNITHFSIFNKQGNRSLNCFFDALTYCVKNGFDIVSLSLGFVDRSCLPDMLPIMKSKMKTMFVAAAANSFQITYPAALSNVLGVKRSLIQSNSRYVEAINPPDGIELIANLPESRMKKNINNNYNAFYSDTNSIIVPQLCGTICSEFLREERNMITKESVLRKITGMEKMNSTQIFQLPSVLGVNEDEQIPVVVIPYKSTIEENAIHNFVSNLQIQFEVNGYMCSVVGDIYSYSDFENARYVLDCLKINDCIAFYQNAVMDSIVLVACNINCVCGMPYDMKITDWLTKGEREVYAEILMRYS